MGGSKTADVANSALGFRPVALPDQAIRDSSLSLARELHDGVAGELATMLLELERFRAEQVGRQGVLVEIARMQDQLRYVLANVRQLVYVQRDLSASETHFIESLRTGLISRFAERTGIRTHLRVGRAWPRALPAETALNLRRIVQEALNNVDRHSGARSVLIRLDVPAGSDWATLKVMDDGRGTDGAPPGFGLVGIAERALLIGAQASFGNRRRGGSVLTVKVPRRTLMLQAT